METGWNPGEDVPLLVCSARLSLSSPEAASPKAAAHLVRSVVPPPLFCHLCSATISVVPLRTTSVVSPRTNISCPTIKVVSPQLCHLHWEQFSVVPPPPTLKSSHFDNSNITSFGFWGTRFTRVFPSYSVKVWLKRALSFGWIQIGLVLKGQVFIKKQCSKEKVISQLSQ